MITVQLSTPIVDLCRAKAQSASIGGVSRVRQPEARRFSLYEDQFVGMLGQAAFSKYWFGSYDQFRASRWVADRNPRSGDGGSDFIGMNVDVKTSLMRGSSNPLDYHLWIRDREWHSESVYVLCLLPSLPANGPVTAHLIGWISGRNVQEKSGDRREVKAIALQHLPEVKWW